MAREVSQACRNPIEKQAVANGIRDVLLCLSYLHVLKVFHKDIKDENIFVEDWSFFVADLGGVKKKFLDRDWDAGTRAYMSHPDVRQMSSLKAKMKALNEKAALEGETPEIAAEQAAVLAQAEELAAKMDLFAVGLTFYSLVVGKDQAPFGRPKLYCDTTGEAKAMFPKSGPAMAIQKEAGNDVYEFMELSWVANDKAQSSFQRSF